MNYIDTNILISLLKSKRKIKGEDFLISEFSLIELERIKTIENLIFDFIPVSVLKIKKLSIDFKKLKNFSKIILDKSYISDFIHLEICNKYGLNFLTKDKKLAKVIHIYPNLKLI